MGCRCSDRSHGTPRSRPPPAAFRDPLLFDVVLWFLLRVGASLLIHVAPSPVALVLGGDSYAPRMLCQSHACLCKRIKGANALRYVLITCTPPPSVVQNDFMRCRYVLSLGADALVAHAPKFLNPCVANEVSPLAPKSHSVRIPRWVLAP